jgi:hypothetical protein
MQPFVPTQLVPFSNAKLQRLFDMKDEYDFSQSVPNSYLKKLKKQVNINLGENVVDYFQKLSEQTGIPTKISLISIFKIVYGLSASHLWNGFKYFLFTDFYPHWYH